MELDFESFGGNLTWLASYPKSGNTWLRCLIASYLTGEVNPNHLPAGLDQFDLKPSQYQLVAPKPLAEMTPPAVTALRGAVLQQLATDRRNMVKTHHARIRVHGQDLIPDWMTKKAIYLVRDPRDVASSLSAHLGISTEAAVDMMGDERSVLNHGRIPTLMHFLTSWSDHVDSWMKAPFDALAVQYEAIKEDPKGQLSDILAFLGFDVDSDRVARAVEAASMERMQVVESEEGFREHRNGVFFGDVRPQLTDAMRQRIENDHGSVMQALGYL